MPSPETSPSVTDVAVALILKQTTNIDSTYRGVDTKPHEILITKRKTNTPYAGFWEFPGGKVDPGETPAACAERECLEELGVRVRVLSVLDEVVHTYPHATVRLYPCLCVMDPGSPAPRALEVADFRWCPLDCLPWDEFLPANVRLVTALHRHLSPGRGSTD